MIYLKIREVAELKGISRRKLAMKSGVDINNVRKIFNDPYAIINTETLDKIAKVLEVDASMLLQSVPDKEKNPEYS